MALQKTLQGKGNADVSYHMIKSGGITKDLVTGVKTFNFPLYGFKDEETRVNNPQSGHLMISEYSMPITDEQLEDILSILNPFAYVKANDSRFSDAIDIL